MRRLKARWLLPVSSAPVRDGWVEVADGLIAGVGDGPAEGEDAGNVAILPSLVNAHTHLELSYLHRVVPPAQRFVDWVRPLMAARQGYPDPADPVIVAAARRAIAEARAAGTGLIGDISNTLVTAPLLAEATVPAHLFFEQLGFNVADPEGRVKDARAKLAAIEGVRASLAAHAPYSVSPGLFAAIRADLDAHPGSMSSVHLGESPEESELLKRGTGPWKTVLTELGVWSADWTAPQSSPVEYLEDLGFLDRCVLAVHGVQFSGEDLSRLRTLNVTVVSCPRSNQYVGAGKPPIEAFYAMNVSVAFGTDSLASVEDLNLFSELAAARRLAPRVPARALLESATLTGANALGFGSEYGSIEPGKRASLIAVRLPDFVDDVEEYLVGGINPEDVSWIE